MGNNSGKKLLSLNHSSRVLVAVVVLGLGLMVPLLFKNNDGRLEWADWTGFGADITKVQSTERNAEGQIQKITTTEALRSGKTLWDCLGLAGMIAVPILLFSWGTQLQKRENKRVAEQAQLERDAQEREKERAAKQAQQEKDIVAINLRDEALQAYFDRMSNLLLNKDLNRSEINNPVRDVARIITLTILRRLRDDKELKTSALRFLDDAELLKILDLSNADLSGADLSSTNLSKAKLSNADLSNANLRMANFNGADLNTANLSSTDLSLADLVDADLSNAELSNAELSNADLSNADLSNANLSNANLSNADLSNADLSNANLSNTNLSNANLSNANLIDVEHLMLDQVKGGQNWERARYSSKLLDELRSATKSTKNL